MARGAGNGVTLLSDSEKKRLNAEQQYYDDLYAKQAQQAAAYQAQQKAAATKNTTTTTSTGKQGTVGNVNASAQEHLQQKLSDGTMAKKTATTTTTNNTKSYATTNANNRDTSVQKSNVPTISLVAPENIASVVSYPNVVEPTVKVEEKPVNNSGSVAPISAYAGENNVSPYKGTYVAPQTEVSAAPQTTTQTTTQTTSQSEYTPSYVEPTIVKFTPSEEYYKAMDETNRLLEQLRGGRTSYTDKITSALASIENNPAFSYDFNADPLFQAQLASAMRSGQTAMQDTMGQAAALTGGYGNTYGQAVGNQAYNSYIQGAYDNLPEYYNSALNKYNSDLQNKYNLLNQYRVGDESEYERMYNDWKNQYTMANDQYSKEFENFWQENQFNEDSKRWAEEYNDAQNKFLETIRQYDNDFAERVREYDTDDAYRNERAARSDYEWDTSFNYDKYRDSVADTQWQKNYDYKVNNTGNDSTTQDITLKHLSDSLLKSAAQNKTEEAYWKWADEMVDKGYDPEDFDTYWSTLGNTVDNIKTTKDNPRYTVNRDGVYYDTQTGKVYTVGGHVQNVHFRPTGNNNTYLDDFGTLYTLDEIKKAGLERYIISD